MICFVDRCVVSVKYFFDISRLVCFSVIARRDAHGLLEPRAERLRVGKSHVARDELDALVALGEQTAALGDALVQDVAGVWHARLLDKELREPAQGDAELSAIEPCIENYFDQSQAFEIIDYRILQKYNK